MKFLKETQQYGLVEWLEKGTGGKIEFTVLPISQIKDYNKLSIIEGNKYTVIYKTVPHECILKYKGNKKDCDEMINSLLNIPNKTNSCNTKNFTNKNNANHLEILQHENELLKQELELAKSKIAEQEALYRDLEVKFQELQNKTSCSGK